MSRTAVGALPFGNKKLTVLSYSENYLLRGRQWFEGDFMSQAFQALDQLARQTLRLLAVEEGRTQLSIRRPALLHVLDAPQQRLTHRHQRPLPVPPLGPPTVLRC
jgi:hypothetical protein